MLFYCKIILYNDSQKNIFWPKTLRAKIGQVISADIFIYLEVSVICSVLQYNINSTAICKMYSFIAMHNTCPLLIRYHKKCYKIAFICKLLLYYEAPMLQITYTIYITERQDKSINDGIGVCCENPAVQMIALRTMKGIQCRPCQGHHKHLKLNLVHYRTNNMLISFAILSFTRKSSQPYLYGHI